MKIGIDSYCYHRFFGEIYSGLETDPGTRMNVWDFLDRAASLKVAGVSLESCFFGDIDDGMVARLRARLDELGLERVWAWGHPRGLASGAAPEQAADLIRHLALAARLGAGVMRICAGGRATRPASWKVHRAAVLPLLRELVGPAEEHGVVLAVENHIDLLADEMLDLITTINSPWLGVCLDTANNIRMFEEPLEVVAKLAPYARATHVKDVTTRRGDPKTFAFWPSTPLGEGLIDIPEVFSLLKRNGYQGLLALELDYLDPRYELDAAVQQSIDAMRVWLNAHETQ
ncbi:MAG: sugar phosphate isomerase/epimerase [Rhodopila sp.]|nr:sugar phosphate isomerase/epimerase [Rhodopila sp.]